MSNIAIIGIVAIVAVVGIIFFLKGKKTEEAPQETSKETQETKTETAPQQSTPEPQPKVEEKKLPAEIEVLQSNITTLMDKVEEDIKKAMDEYGMDRDTIVEMLKELQNQLESQRETIYQLLSKKDWVNLEREIHSLKGAALNLKFETLGGAIRYIDDILKEERDLDNLKEYLDILYKVEKDIFSKL